MPAELHQPEMLDRVRERVVEDAEAGPVGSWLAAAPVAMPTDAEQASWQDAVAAGSAHEVSVYEVSAFEVNARQNLASGLFQAPRQPEARVWSRVRRSILADVALAAKSTVRRRPMRNILLAGVAASAVLGLFVLSEGTPPTPTIVFTELQRAPDLDFAVVRYGSRR